MKHEYASNRYNPYENEAQKRSIRDGAYECLDLIWFFELEALEKKHKGNK